jgi:exopolysaccharide biosynthesis predicted pyruvyltransferase EpsI
MSIDNYLIDNSYSKNKHYYDAWMADLEYKGDMND